MVEISVRFSYYERNGVTIVVIDDGVLGVKWPGEVSSKRKKEAKCMRKRVFEFGKNGTKEEWGWMRELVQEDALNRW